MSYVSYMDYVYSISYMSHISFMSSIFSQNHLKWLKITGNYMSCFKNNNVFGVYSDESLETLKTWKLNTL